VTSALLSSVNESRADEMHDLQTSRPTADSAAKGFPPSRQMTG